jgi:gamma-glutamyl phosphate reductase
VPVIGHLEGICHVYLHEAADAAMAAEIAVNAKMRRTGICGAAETLLVDRGAAARLLPGVLTALRNAGCEIRGDSDVVEFFPEAKQASEDDWGTEYLDAILSVRVVDDIDAAIQHISEYGSGHTECIVTNDDGAAGKFFRNVDSAILLQNASTQFADGGEFGMGAPHSRAWPCRRGAADELQIRGPRQRTNPSLMTAESRTFDVAVIGAGINGAGVARDAALRGLSVVLFERPGRRAA